MKKKLLALVLAACMVASMAACGNTNSSGSASVDNKDASATSNQMQLKAGIFQMTDLLTHSTFVMD